MQKGWTDHVFSPFDLTSSADFEALLEIRGSIPPSGAASWKRDGPKWHPQPQAGRAGSGTTRTASHSAEKTGLQTSSLFVSRRGVPATSFALI